MTRRDGTGNIPETRAESSWVSRPERWNSGGCLPLGSFISIHPVSTFSAGLSLYLEFFPPFFLLPVPSVCPWVNMRPPCI